MTKSTIFISSSQSSMIDGAILKLTDDITDLSAAKTAYANLMDNQSITSGAVSILKQIAYDYTVAVGACITADELDIKDLRTLKNNIGSEDYDGNEILTGKEDAFRSYEENLEKYNSTYKEFLDLDWWRVLEESFLMD